MNYTFDYEYMRDEMIDFALVIKNEDMFRQLTSEHYEDYVAQFLGFQNKQAFDIILKGEEKESQKVKHFVDWIEKNKYEKHKLVIRYLIEHPSLIDVEEEASCEKWDQISRILMCNLPTDWLSQKMTRYFGAEVAKDFLAYIGMFKQ